MNQPATRIGLWLGMGVPTPAPSRLMSALDTVDVQQTDDAGTGTFGQGFQVTFRAERGLRVQEDLTLVTDPLLKIGTRIIVTVSIDARTHVLLDGVISHHQLAPATEGGAARFTVTGEDLSIAMDMVEVSFGYPALDDADIVFLVLARYAALGVLPTVIPTPQSWRALPSERIPFQTGTDREYVRSLAVEHGYTFGIRPGPRPLMSVAFWGPRIKLGLPQPALSVDLGPETNVKSIEFAHDGLAGVQTYGTHHYEETPAPIPYFAAIGMDIPLSRSPSLLGNQPFVKKIRRSPTGPSFIRTLENAVGQTTQSTRRSVTAKGSIDVLRYRNALTAPGIVGVRGAGRTFDGNYYVQKVTHHLSTDGYTQDFELSREGTGAQTNKVHI